LSVPEDSDQQEEGTGGLAVAGSRRGTALAVAGLVLVLFLVSLDQTVVGTALPVVIAELDGFELYAWVTTSYLLAETVMIPIVGKVGDLYGRKWITISGVAVFLLGSFLCGVSTSMIELVVFRGVQGLGGGMLLATVFASVADIFPDPQQRARYQGLFFGVFSISSVIGPSLGGWITDTISWRWVFFINLPLGILALAALPFVLPQSRQGRGAKIDFLGAATITVSIVALLLALSWVGEGDGWGSTRVLVGLAIAVVSFALFVPIELRVSEPILPFSLFRDRTMASVSFVMFFFGVGFFGIILYTPLFVQGVLGQTATGSGAVLTPLILTMTAIGIVGGVVMAKTNRLKPFLIGGMALMSAGVLLLSTLGVGSSTLTVAVFLFVTGLGMGLVMPTTTLAVQTKAGPEQMGVATSATQFVRSVGSTVGTAVIGSIVTAGYVRNLGQNAPEAAPDRLVGALEDPNALVSPEAMNALERAADQVPGGAGLVDGLLGAARESLAGAIQAGFLLVLGTTLIALVGALFLENLRLKEGAPLKEEAQEEKEAAAAGATSAAPREPRRRGGKPFTETDL
jgi:EmrB/QacA subfamily drug resistance transporter